MTAHPATTHSTTDDLASEAARYLEVIEVYASLGADPHASARKRAAHARHLNHAAPSAPGRRRRWRP